MYTGVSTKRKFAVKNNSRIPLTYEWNVPEKYRNEVRFEPVSSMLQPNEETQVYCTFTPLKKKNYVINASMFSRSIFDMAKNTIGFFNPGSGTQMSARDLAEGCMNLRKDIQILGAGNDGSIKISPLNLDFGTITVGFAKTLSVVVTNESNCNLYIELRMQHNKDGSEHTSLE